MKKNIFIVVCIALVMLLSACTQNVIKHDTLTDTTLLKIMAEDFDLKKIAEDAVDGGNISLDVNVIDKGDSVYYIMLGFEDYALGENTRINSGELILAVGTHPETGAVQDYSIGTEEALTATIKSRVLPTMETMEIPLSGISIRTPDTATLSGFKVDPATLTLVKTVDITAVENPDTTFKTSTATVILGEV